VKPPRHVNAPTGRNRRLRIKTLDVVSGRCDPTGQRMLHDTEALTRQGTGWSNLGRQTYGVMGQS
jgi:hypothetical protein